MLPRNHPDRIRIAFDDHRLVANTGLILPATLARRLGLPELVDQHLDLDLGHATGRANTGDKMMTLVASALAGATASTTPTCCAPGGTARARFPTGPLRLLQLSRVHHRPGRGDPGTGGRPSPTRRDRECHPRPQVRCRPQSSSLGPFRRQRRLAGRPGNGA